MRWRKWEMRANGSMGLALAVALLAGGGCAPNSGKSSGAAESSRPLASSNLDRSGRGARAAAALAYPPTAVEEHIDHYHGAAVADPYRWLEDDRSAATAAWVAAQNRVTFDYLATLPEREAIRRRLTRLWNYERYGVPYKEGGRYFITRNDGLQNQSVLYTMDGLHSPFRPILDPNAMSADGAVSLRSTEASDDGRLLAYGFSTAGSDWQEIGVRDLRSGEDLPDRLQWVKFSGASWRKDNTGFFYSRYDAPKTEDQLKGVNYYQKLYFHRIGSPQASDVLVYERKDHKDWGFGGQVTDDGQYLIITVRQGTDRRRRVFYKDPRELESQAVELLNDFDAAYDFIDNDGPVFWFLTDLDAPRGRVVAIDTRRPERAHWKEVIPETEATLRSVDFIHGRFVCHYLEDACSRVRIVSADGRASQEMALPGIGTVSGLRGRKEDTETFFSFTSYTAPGTIYRYDFETGEREVYKEPVLDVQPEDYETKQVFYTSRDGTRVPMFITHRNGTRLDGNRPVLLYGYGGFNLVQTPSFSAAVMGWLEMGGVYAVANLRGGGEYGQAWHRAGMKERKQTVFDDFIAAAEWLIRERYTRPDKLAIMGRSNGGLLVGACMTQRPDLFGAALPAVGVMDMLRFHKFTIGWAWTSEYGSSDDPAMFPVLLGYSPYHRLQPGVHYPATLVTTADHDDRVVPAHSFKFAARLQACQAGTDPVLIRIETEAGHGAGKPTSKLIEETADQWAFLVHHLDFQPRWP